MNRFEYLKSLNIKEFAGYFVFYNADNDCYEGIDGILHTTKEECVNSNIHWLSHKID